MVLSRMRALRLDMREPLDMEDIWDIRRLAGPPAAGLITFPSRPSGAASAFACISAALSSSSRAIPFLDLRGSGAVGSRGGRNERTDEAAEPLYSPRGPHDAHDRVPFERARLQGLQGGGGGEERNLSGGLL